MPETSDKNYFDSQDEQLDEKLNARLFRQPDSTARVMYVFVFLSIVLRKNRKR